MSDHSPFVASRRDFLRTSTAVAGTSLAGLTLARSVHAAGDDTLKVGLIGCGGRGTGAAKQALNADDNVKLTAMGDVFRDHLDSSLANLEKQDDVAGKLDVAEDHKFTGFDAYQQVLDSDVDVVILTTPPHFRPAHLKAAIDAGKHVFCEKPVAVDATGVRSVIETCKAAKEKNLSLVSGLCWRYDNGVRETMQRVADGEIGDIVAIQENYLAGGLWKHARRPEWSDMEYQLRNWLYYTWLSGDHNVEQHVHSLDKAVWAMGDTPPVRAVGLGGRQARVEPIFGHIFDHHAVVYEWPNGVKMFAYCRQQDGCTTDVDDYILGTKGRATVLKNRIEGEKSWKYRGEKNNMYQTEHDELFASIRSGNPINNGHYMTVSTMVAILGRMATYTGKSITWDEAINSSEDLTPAAGYEWGPLEMPLVAVPGQTQLVV
ncbi:MAG: Gfo/Idh/MocA family oxidoreductase [Planctomycetales bacterium]|nr:Gfo/Idh/MocA family oxidoreductase [Planctomycetales bacterium]